MEQGRKENQCQVGELGFSSLSASNKGNNHRYSNFHYGL